MFETVKADPDEMAPVLDKKYVVIDVLIMYASVRLFKSTSPTNNLNRCQF